MEREELAAWLRLLEAPRLGREAARKLLAAFASPQAVLDAPAGVRASLIGPAGAALDAPSEGFDARLEATWRWLGEAPGRDIVTLGDAAYPQALLSAPDPPLLLYLHGRTELLERRALAIVGSRNPTPQGSDNARAFAAHLSASGWCVVSGLALGIDGAAHEGALDGRGGTIAVVGTGLDRVYPQRHLQLARRIAAEGLLLSEFALGTPALGANFPRRNRLIAGLARGTLVVEAALQSGSLITARLAAEAGRDVFAIPGSIHSPQSRGCHALIRQGAKLVESVADILDELGAAPAAAPAPPAVHTATDDVLDALGHDPASLDALVARTGWPTERLSARLLELELEGVVARLPGGLFQRRGCG